MSSAIECDGCHTILKNGEPYFCIERLGVGGLGVSEVFGARTEFDICSPACLGTLAADLLEATC
jgi:hypothetical protein